MSASFYSSAHRTRRLEIRAFRKSDWSVWQKGFRERRADSGHFETAQVGEASLTREKFFSHIEKNEMAADAGKYFFFGVFLRRTGECVGTIDLFSIEKERLGWANLGYMIHSQFAGQGYAKEAAKKALEIGFLKAGFQRIEATMEKNHRASISIARAIGLQKEALRRGFLPGESGSWKDAYVYSLNRDEYKKL